MKIAEFKKTISYILALAVLLGIFLPQPTLAQGGDPLCFNEQNGHCISGQFLKFYNDHGGLELLGYPITEPFMDQGITVQYFQKARLELHPLNPDPYKVQLGLLGDELNYRQAAVAPPKTLSRRQYYAEETGHLVSYAFLDYFKAHGGVDIFGLPITEMYFEEGRIVQYFQRLKMEWHPENRSNPVSIGNLGELYITVNRERIPAPALKAASAIPSSVTVTPTSITAIRAVVSLRYSVMGKERSQTVSVLVTDSNGTPLPKAAVQISFFDAKGALLSTSQQFTTDARGFVKETIPVAGGRTGEQVIVQAKVTFGTLQATAQNVFLLWW
jgi:hypothetical protein